MAQVTKSPAERARKSDVCFARRGPPVFSDPPALDHDPLRRPLTMMEGGCRVLRPSHRGILRCYASSETSIPGSRPKNSAPQCRKAHRRETPTG